MEVYSMQKVRFLIPFLIFLVLFLMTSAFCYYFFNEKMQVIEKQKAVENAIGTLLPTTYSSDSTEDREVEIGIKSSLFIRTVNLRKKLESIENKTGCSTGQKHFVTVLDISSAFDNNVRMIFEQRDDLFRSR